MASLNKVLLIGNLTRDPDVRYTPKGSAVAEIGIAVNRSYTLDSGEKREEVTFVDVTLWGRTAEIAAQYLKKGRPVFIEGRLQLDSWDDKQSGQKRSKLKVVGEAMQFLGGRGEGGEGGGGGGGEGDDRPPYQGGGQGGGENRPSARPSSAPPRSGPPQASRQAPEPSEPEEDDIPF